ncbi:MAG: beta-lactamase family protein [Gammaproteobacteria bacterium]|nr:beta-lactamase family protein [Gammaproteobacteria bacterium]
MRRASQKLINYQWIAALLLVSVGGCAAPESGSDTTAASEPAWEPPPGEAIVHHTGGFAKTLCSAIFITGLDPADAAANVGGFTAPFEHRAAVQDIDIDPDNERVTLTLASGLSRTAGRYGSQGCITHALGDQPLYFEPSAVEPQLPDPSTTPWPMGDVLSEKPYPREIDMDKVARAIEVAMGADGKPLGMVVTHRGRIIGEAYGEGVDMHTPFESWSMGKSLTGTLMGVLIHQGTYQLWQPAPIPEWQGDARKDIRIGDIMRMSSGIRIRAPQDPDYDPELGYPDHLYLYTGDNAFAWAASRPQEWQPNTIGRYRNSDPVLTNYLIRLAVDGRGEDYHAFPQRNLFDKLGIQHLVMETDPHGNFLTQGYEFGSARDWARLGNLYLQDGVWEDERLLPEGYVDYAFETAPAWIADGRPIYGGGFLWKDLGFPIDYDYAAFAGAGGQYTIIVPARELVVVRLGKYTGAGPGRENLNAALELLLAAFPRVAF